MRVTVTRERIMTLRSLVCASACLALSVAAGCGGDDDNGPDAAPGGSVDSMPIHTADGMPGGSDDGMPDDGNATFTVTWDPITVGSGQENTQCVVKKLGNSERIYVDSVHNVLGQGSHHMIVYKVSDTEERPDQFDCQPFTDALTKGGAPIVISQKADDLLTLPDGVAFNIAPDQMIRIELHYINTSDADETIQASTTFHTVPAAEVEDEAGFVFMGTANIDLPPHQMTTVGPVYFPLQKTGLDDAHFFAITGHTHKLGLDVQVATAPSEGGADTPVYDVENFNWDEPATIFYNDAPFQVPADGGFRFSCDYNNTTDSPVSFGESTKEEMCFFWAYYYPSEGSKLCIDYPGTGPICVDAN